MPGSISTFFMLSATVLALWTWRQPSLDILVYVFVKCAYRGLVLGAWVQWDKPAEERRRHCPHRSSLRRGLEVKRQESNGEDVCGRFKTFETLWSTTQTRTVHKDWLETLHMWPLKCCGNPVNLAAFEFFYSGRSNHVKWFCFGSQTDSWQRKEDPWIEHIRSSPACGYIHLTNLTAPGVAVAFSTFCFLPPYENALE